MPEITVPANGIYPDQPGARSIFIDSVAGGADEVTCRIKGDGLDEKQVLRAGSKLLHEGGVIDEIVFQNDTGAAIDVTYHVSTLLVYDEARLSGTVTGAVPGTLVDITDVVILAVTKTLILAANTARKEAIITADAGNLAVSRIGSTNAGAARGTPLAAGAVLIIETTDAVYAYSANAATFQISYTEF